MRRGLAGIYSITSESAEIDSVLLIIRLIAGDAGNTAEAHIIFANLRPDTIHMEMLIGSHKTLKQCMKPF